MRPNNRKRPRSPASGGIPAIKKRPRTSPNPASSVFTLRPPPPAPSLELSTLVWRWMPLCQPCTVQVGDTTSQGLGGRSPRLYKSGAQWSTEQSAYEYRPEAPMKLRYTRKIFTGTTSTDITYYGTIAGEHYGGGGIGPLLRLHRAGEPAFPGSQPQPDEVCVDTEGAAVGCGPGPPHDIFETDWLGNLEVDRTLASFIRNLDGAFEWCITDLPGQGNKEEPVVVGYDPDDDEGKHVEPDAAKYNGWSGPWVAVLLAKEEQKVDLGTRVEVQWEDGGLWGVEFEFKPISFEPYWPDSYADSGKDSSTEFDDEGPNLAGYTVEATVRRVFVKTEWFDEEDE